MWVVIRLFTAREIKLAKLESSFSADSELGGPVQQGRRLERDALGATGR